MPTVGIAFGCVYRRHIFESAPRLFSPPECHVLLNTIVLFAIRAYTQSNRNAYAHRTPRAKYTTPSRVHAVWLARYGDAVPDERAAPQSSQDTRLALSTPCAAEAPQ